MKYSLKKLPGNLRVLVTPMPSLESTTITIWVKTGSRFEEEKISGISHFLEHMVFKGSKKRPSAKEISEAVDSFGGEFNAGTSKDWTNFYIKSGVKKAETAMDVLSDMVLNPILDKEEIEREKGTIIQELAMYEDTPLIKIQDVFEALAFSENPLSWDVGGTPESVKKIQKDDFLRYRDIHYYTENILVTIAGGITENEGLSLVGKYFAGVEKTKPESDGAGVVFKDLQQKARFKLHSKKVEQAHFILGFMSDGRGYKGRFIQSVLSSILGGGMSSRLFTEIRERRGLAYAVKSSGDKFDEVGYFGMYAGTDPGKADEAVKVTLDQFYGLANGKYPVTDKELTKAKEYIKGHIALSLEDTNTVNDFFGEQALFLPEILTPEEIYEKIDSVTKDEILSEAKRLFKPEKLNLAIIGPFKGGSRFEKLL